MARLEDEIQTAQETQPKEGINESERMALIALADDLAARVESLLPGPPSKRANGSCAQSSKRWSSKPKSRVRLRLKPHWKGGDHTSLEVTHEEVAQGSICC